MVEIVATAPNTVTAITGFRASGTLRSYVLIVISPRAPVLKWNLVEREKQQLKKEGYRYKDYILPNEQIN
jgi:hypothetical protein